MVDFNVCNEKPHDGGSSSEDEQYGANKSKDSTKFSIQIFGVNEKGETCSVLAEDYKPFFYIMVDDRWSASLKESFLKHLKTKVGKFYENSIIGCILVKRKKLYGFDGGKEHKFIRLEFANIQVFNKVKNLWYSDYQSGHTLLKEGYNFQGTNIKLYEANIPPLLRFFHVRDISPSGWVALPKNKVVEMKGENKKTTCCYEFVTNYKNIIPLNDKETRVPYKIMSFDIEASSSHGDFPIPVKSYKKLATNIIEYFENVTTELTPEFCKSTLTRILLTAFGYDNVDQIDLLYPKKHPGSKETVLTLCEKWLSSQVRDRKQDDTFKETATIESLFERMGQQEEEGVEEEYHHHHHYVKAYNAKKATISDILCDKKFEREGKLNELNLSLNAHFPRLEGDKVTFIGSTFMNFGEKEPFQNHCIVLNTCDKIPMENTIHESYSTEKEVLLAWQQLVQRENPDIIIGYNIFGFDYEFLFRRAEENYCIEEFMKLSRNKDELCCVLDKETGKYKIEETTIHIASGQHDLRFIKMNGRLQIDLYNYYRREANLTSYKLDSVAGHFIGDFVKEVSLLQETQIKEEKNPLVKSKPPT